MNILCPIDFSDHSKIALEYAVNFSNHIDAQLHIISVYQIKKTASSFISIDQKIRETNIQDMKIVVAGISPLIKNDKEPISQVIQGNTVSTILDYCAQNDIGLIIMGTQGSNSLRTILFGGITRKVTEKSNTPVLAIPELISSHGRKNNNLLLALDDKILEHESTFEIPLRIANAYNLKIDILHVENEEEGLPFDPYISAYLGNRIGEVILEKDSDPIKFITQYAQKQEVMMLIMVKRKQGFFNRLLKVANTSEELARIQLPLLILPE